MVQDALLWLQLKKVKVEIDFDAQFNVAHLHIFTALAGTPPVAVTNSIVFSDATIEVTVENLSASPSLAFPRIPTQPIRTTVCWPCR
jgi:hypothetical protein